MDERVYLWETPTAKENVMIAGWHQWADAGSISSGLPAYLIEKLDTRKIGEISRERFFLFQMPGAHHLLRPEVHTKDGVVQEMRVIKSELHYAELGGKGVVIFLGEEPHVNEEEYAEAFFDITEALGVNRIMAVGGVYGAMPYNKDRDISCVFSLEKIGRRWKSTPCVSPTMKAARRSVPISPTTPDNATSNTSVFTASFRPTTSVR